MDHLPRNLIEHRKRDPRQILEAEFAGAERAQQAREAGAWGVAAIGAVWDAADSYEAALELVRGDQ